MLNDRDEVEDTRSLKYVLNSKQYFFDRDLKTVVPRVVNVIYSKSVLVICVPRRALRVDFKMSFNLCITGNHYLRYSLVLIRLIQHVWRFH